MKYTICVGINTNWVDSTATQTRYFIAKHSFFSVGIESDSTAIQKTISAFYKKNIRFVCVFPNYFMKSARKRQKDHFWWMMFPAFQSLSFFGAFTAMRVLCFSNIFE